MSGGGGGVTQECFSKSQQQWIFQDIGEITRKNLLSKEELRNFIGSINFGQTSCSNLDTFGMGKDIPDCQLAQFA